MRQYIIDPTEARGQTLGLLPGINYWKTQLTKNGPWVGVKTIVHEPRNELGEIAGDCAYCIWIGENEIPWDRWGNGRMTLIGEQITEPEYNYVLKALEWDRVNLGHDEKKAVDLMAMPPVPPPSRAPVILSPDHAGALTDDAPFPTRQYIAVDLARGPDMTVETVGTVMSDGSIRIDGLQSWIKTIDLAADTPEASALADAILPPIDVEIKE